MHKVFLAQAGQSDRRPANLFAVVAPDLVTARTAVSSLHPDRDVVAMHAPEKVIYYFKNNRIGTLLIVKPEGNAAYPLISESGKPKRPAEEILLSLLVHQAKMAQTTAPEPTV